MRRRKVDIYIYIKPYINISDGLFGNQSLLSKFEIFFCFLSSKKKITIYN
jgi:hypothetical protein